MNSRPCLSFFPLPSSPLFFLLPPRSSPSSPPPPPRRYHRVLRPSFLRLLPPATPSILPLRYGTSASSEPSPDLCPKPERVTPPIDVTQTLADLCKEFAPASLSTPSAHWTLAQSSGNKKGR
ncbi:hypothetical protein B0T10DRAFT_466025 [Thelonectria olida]|uniref:Uncharacterized protein n=1 Tax=Thelonectria olida TaxID=1576542 RepID=A0A9P9AFL3_9HYPO|nr:hypothetical protein B0T10DRAFT_466025 [Thelonectria olida]